MCQSWASSALSLSHLSSQCSSCCRAGLPDASQSIPSTARGRCPAWPGPVTAQGGHPTSAATSTCQTVHGTQTLWPWAAWPGSTEDVGTWPDFACPFPGPSPHMAVQSNCFSKGLKTHSGLRHCRMGTSSGALLGILAHMAGLARSPAGMTWKYFWLPGPGGGLSGPVMPALSSCLPLA